MNGVMIITDEKKKYIEKYFGKIETLDDDVCVKIIEDLCEELEKDDIVTSAEWYDAGMDRISYEYYTDETSNEPDFMDMAKELMLESGAKSYCY